MATSGSNDNDQYVLVGKVAKPHGVKGEIKIFPYSGEPDNFHLYTRIYVCPESGSGGRWFTILKVRSQGKYVIVTLDGLHNRDDAEKLGQCEVSVDQQDLPPLDDDEYYWHDFEGMRVETKEGHNLGTVESLLATAGHDILVVTGQGQEYMIPALDEFVVEIREETDTLVVDPPDGLLEINRKG